MKLSEAIISKCNTALTKLRAESEAITKVLDTELAAQSKTKSDRAVLLFLEAKVGRTLGVLENLQGQLEYIQSKALDLQDGGVDKDVKGSVGVDGEA